MDYFTQEDMHMDTTHKLPEAGYLRLAQIIGDKKSNPPIAGIFPVSRSHFYKGIQEGVYPKPTHVGRTSLWKVDDIKNLLHQIDAGLLANG